MAYLSEEILKEPERIDFFKPEIKSLPPASWYDKWFVIAIIIIGSLIIITFNIIKSYL